MIFTYYNIQVIVVLLKFLLLFSSLLFSVKLFNFANLVKFTKLVTEITIIEGELSQEVLHRLAYIIVYIL